MITLRESAKRGHSQAGWLDSRHTFSFSDYYDPENMGFRTLRVLNEDRVLAGQGFGRHPHRDMEIISIVLEGALEHKDSIGTGSVIRPGDVQRMSAGTGVTHSEFNHSQQEPVHFFQTWIVPEKRGLPPSYEQKRFEPDQLRDHLRLVASRDGREGSVTVHQDVALYLGRPSAGMGLTHNLAPDRHAWVQVARGDIKIGELTLHAGDGAAVSSEVRIVLRAQSDAELLLFDLA